MAAALVLIVGVASGCLNGAIYEHTVRPLDVNFDATPSGIVERRAATPRDSWKTLVIPIFVGPGRIQLDWGDASIARAIRDAGLRRVHYADLERLSVLGVWTQRWVLVYGE